MWLPMEAGSADYDHWDMDDGIVFIGPAFFWNDIQASIKPRFVAIHPEACTQGLAMGSGFGVWMDLENNPNWSPLKLVNSQAKCYKLEVKI